MVHSLRVYFVIIFFDLLVVLCPFFITWLSYRLFISSSSYFISRLFHCYIYISSLYFSYSSYSLPCFITRLSYHLNSSSPIISLPGHFIFGYLFNCLFHRFIFSSPSHSVSLFHHSVISSPLHFTSGLFHLRSLMITPFYYITIFSSPSYSVSLFTSHSYLII